MKMPAPRIILIACGSFNPPTPLHLRMFEIARDYFHDVGHYEVIGGVISPVHDSYGKKGLVEATHRAAMVKLALQSSNWIRLSDWETTQNNWARTITTLEYHQNFVNNFLNDINGTVNEVLPGWLPSGIRSRRDKIQVKLLCGADLLESFAVPGLWQNEDIEAILENHGLVVISRSGTNPEKFIFESDILTRLKKNIEIVTNWVPNEISSTLIRRLLSRQQSVKYLIDDHVIEYIKKVGIYNSNAPKYDLSPNQNQLIMNQNYVNDQYTSMAINTTESLTPTSDGETESMEQNDNSLTATKRSTIAKLDNDRANVFCCTGGEGMKLRSILNRPGQAIQVITKSPESKFDNDEVKSKKLRKSTAAV